MAKKKSTQISNAVIKRLPRYRRYLIELHKKGVTKISSKEFSNLIGYTASQIRQDLNNFGGFGQQGYGYSVEGLYKEISGILGLDREYKMVIVGAGNLGQAIIKYTRSLKNGFRTLAAFDIREEIIGKTMDGIEILDNEELVEYVENHQVDIGIICVNKDNAQEVADKLSFAGIRGIWNFAPVDIEVPDHIALQNVHLSDSLHGLAYHINDEDRMKLYEEEVKEQKGLAEK